MSLIILISILVEQQRPATVKQEGADKENKWTESHWMDQHCIGVRSLLLINRREKEIKNLYRHLQNLQGEWRKGLNVRKGKACREAESARPRNNNNIQHYPSSRASNSTPSKLAETNQPQLTHRNLLIPSVGVCGAVGAPIAFYYIGSRSIQAPCSKGEVGKLLDQRLCFQVCTMHVYREDRT